MKIHLAFICFFCAVAVMATAQNDDVFCRTLQAMLAETKSGFPSFKGASRNASKGAEYELKQGLTEGTDFTGGRVYLGEYSFDKLFNAAVKRDELLLNTKRIGVLSFTQADTSLVHIFENYVVNIWKGCFADYVVKPQKLDEVDKTYVMSRVVVSKKPVLSDKAEVDPAKILDEPHVVFSLQKDLLSNDAYITIRFKCFNRKQF